MKTLLFALVAAMGMSSFAQEAAMQNPITEQVKEPASQVSPSGTISNNAQSQQEQTGSSAKSQEEKSAPVNESPEQALQRYIQECEGGQIDSCLMLIQGYMREDNPTEAMKYAQKGCDLNSSISCGVMGIITVTMPGSPKDNLSKASEYFEKGCRLGDATSCKTLADIYKTGTLGNVSKEKIMELYRRSCDIGLAAGCQALEQYEENDQQSAPSK